MAATSSEHAEHAHITARTLRASGTGPDETHAMLVRDGLSPRLAAEIVRDVYDLQRAPGFLDRPLGWKGLSLAVGLIVGVNLVLWFSPEIFAGDKLKLCNSIKGELTTRAQEISNLESSLNTAHATIEKDDSALKRRDKELRDGGPRAFASYAAYSQAVDEYNHNVEEHNVLLRKVKADIERYSLLIDQYNERVAAFNAAIKSVPSRSLVFPTLGVARGRTGRTFRR